MVLNNNNNRKEYQLSFAVETSLIKLDSSTPNEPELRVWNNHIDVNIELKQDWQVTQNWSLQKMKATNESQLKHLKRAKKTGKEYIC